MLVKVCDGVVCFKGVFVFVFLVLMVFCFLGCVSAVNLNVDEVGFGSCAVQNHTVTYQRIPSYVSVNGKNSTASSFLKTLTNTVVQLNNSVTTPVSIDSVNPPTGPSGTGSGNLTKYQLSLLQIM